MRIDQFGPLDAFDGRRLSSVLRWISLLKNPWDGLLVCGVAIGLYILAIAGATIGVWSQEWSPGILIGFGMVMSSVVVSAHLSNVNPVTSRPVARRRRS
jgi:hypothetical protein